MYYNLHKHLHNYVILTYWWELIGGIRKVWSSQLLYANVLTDVSW